jgi:hypothetical protein
VGRGSVLTAPKRKQREIHLKKLILAAMPLAFALSGCGQTPAENMGEEVDDVVEAQGDVIDEQSEVLEEKADVAEAAGNDAEAAALESEADAMEDKADGI